MLTSVQLVLVQASAGFINLEIYILWKCLTVRGYFTLKSDGSILRLNIYGLCNCVVAMNLKDAQ